MPILLLRRYPEQLEFPFVVQKTYPLNPEQNASQTKATTSAARGAAAVSPLISYLRVCLHRIAGEQEVVRLVKGVWGGSDTTIGLLKS